MLIYLARKAQVALLLAKKVSVFTKYADFLNVVFKKSTAVFSNCLNINKYVINLEPNKQPTYKSIYSLGLIKLETLKTSIKINLANKFI